jgi:hypothetical protein
MRPYLRGVKTPLGPPLAQNQPWGAWKLQKMSLMGRARHIGSGVPAPAGTTASPTSCGNPSESARATAPPVPAETICKKFQSSLRVPEVVPAIWVALRVRDHSLTGAARCRCTAFPSRAREQAV